MIIIMPGITTFTLCHPSNNHILLSYTIAFGLFCMALGEVWRLEANEWLDKSEQAETKSMKDRGPVAAVGVGVQDSDANGCLPKVFH